MKLLHTERGSVRNGVRVCWGGGEEESKSRPTEERVSERGFRVAGKGISISRDKKRGSVYVPRLMMGWCWRGRRRASGSGRMR